MNAPSVALPLRFTLLGLSALVVGIIWLVLQPEALAQYHYNPQTVAITHLFVLGWIVSIIMGAMYQLVPVALETKLYSERLAKWQFVFHAVGFVGMVWMFREYNMKQVGHFGSVIAFGFALFVYNIARTLMRVPKWNVIATAVASALFWISFAALAGLSIAASRCIFVSPQTNSAGALGALLRGVRSAGLFMAQFAPLSAMHAHAHLGVIGFFIILIVGVSYKLVPMFTLSEIQSRFRAICSIVLLNIGLAGSFAAVLTQSRFKPVCALAVIVALGIYGAEMGAILDARKRRQLDWGIRYFLTGIWVLAPVSALGLYLSQPGLEWTVFRGQLENVYGFLALLGVVTFAIIGMLYKIVPFLVWFTVYGRHIGRARVPALADMYSHRLQAAGYYTYIAGLLLTTPAILTQSHIGVRIGCLLLAVSIATLAVNIALILSHQFRPRLSPLAKPASTPVSL